MTDLLPCPFCGTDAAQLLTGGPGNWYVRCTDCNVSTDDVMRDHAVELWNTRASLSPPHTGPQKDDPLDDPASDARWNAGCDFAMTQLCHFLGIDPDNVTWDAATETVEGDVQSVIGNILRAKFGEDWGPKVDQDKPTSPDPLSSAQRISTTENEHDTTRAFGMVQEASPRIPDEGRRAERRHVDAVRHGEAPGDGAKELDADHAGHDGDSVRRCECGAQVYRRVQLATQNLSAEPVASVDASKLNYPNPAVPTGAQK